MSNHQFRNLALAGAAAYGGYKIWQHVKGNKPFSCTTPTFGGPPARPESITKHYMEGYFNSIDKKCKIEWVRCEMISLCNYTPPQGPLIGWTELRVQGRHRGEWRRVNCPTLLVQEKGRWYEAPIEDAKELYYQLVEEQETKEADEIIAQAEREAEREIEREAVEKRDRAYNASIAEEKIKLLGMRYAEITAGPSHPNPGECLKEGADIIPGSNDDQRIKDLSFDEVFEKIVDDEWFDGSLNAIQSNTLEFPISLSHGTSSIVLMAARVVAMKTGKTDFTWFLADHLTDTEVNEISDNMREDKNKCVYIASWHKIKPKHEKLLRDAFSKCKNFGLIKGFPSQVARHEHDNGIEQRYEQIKEAELDSKRENTLRNIKELAESEEFQASNPVEQYNALLTIRREYYTDEEYKGELKPFEIKAKLYEETLRANEEKIKADEDKVKTAKQKAKQKAKKKADRWEIISEWLMPIDEFGFNSSAIQLWVSVLGIAFIIWYNN